jgi:hypothetical protein
VVRLMTSAIVLALALAACAAPSSHILVGAARPPISPTDVKIYLQPPPSFEEVGVLNASADSMFGTGGQTSVDKVIQRLKEEAAKLGANGIILEGMSDQQTGSVGGGSGSASASGNTAVGVGLGGSLGIFKKTGHARAIFVPPEPPAPPGAPAQ